MITLPSSCFVPASAVAGARAAGLPDLSCSSANCLALMPILVMLVGVGTTAKVFLLAMTVGARYGLPP